MPSRNILKEVKKDLRLTKNRLSFLKDSLSKLTDEEARIVYNRISGYNRRYFRIGNHYFRGYLIRNIIEKRWG